MTDNYFTNFLPTLILHHFCAQTHRSVLAQTQHSQKSLKEMFSAHAFILSRHTNHVQSKFLLLPLYSIFFRHCYLCINTFNFFLSFFTIFAIFSFQITYTENSDSAMEYSNFAIPIKIDGRVMSTFSFKVVYLLFCLRQLTPGLLLHLFCL